MQNHIHQLEDNREVMVLSEGYCPLVICSRAWKSGGDIQIVWVAANSQSLGPVQCPVALQKLFKMQALPLTWLNFISEETKKWGKVCECGKVDSPESSR